MKKLVIFALCLAGMAGIGASPALASASTCATHQLSVDSWTIQTDVINTSGLFKCGGANNDPWHLQVYLQKQVSGSWVQADCDNGNSCTNAYPSGGGFFAGGSQHGFANVWNVSGQIDCKDWRLHARVDFQSLDPPVTFNSGVASVGGC